MRPLADNFYVDTDFGILHEDEDILVINKPAPLAVHAVGSYAELNLHTLLKKNPRWMDCPVKMVHRLDAETSGVLVVAKNYEAARSLGKQFLAGQVQKEYEAVVFGEPPEDHGDITFPLGYDASSGFQTIRIRDEENGERAHTQFEVLSRKDGYARVKLMPRTGRTHQLRAHMALYGYPIVGDKIYIDLQIFVRYVKNGLDEEMRSRLKLPRLALHATRLTFRHPRSNGSFSFSCELPALLRDFVSRQGLWQNTDHGQVVSDILKSQK